MSTTAIAPDTVQAFTADDFKAPDKFTQFCHNGGRPLGGIIGGKQVAGDMNAVIDAINPGTKEVLARVSEMGYDDVNAAVEAGYKAYHGGWKNTSVEERAALIMKMVELFERDLAGLEFIAAFLGCLYARVTAVPLSTPRNALGVMTMLGIVKHADAAVLQSLVFRVTEDERRIETEIDGAVIATRRRRPGGDDQMETALVDAPPSPVKRSCPIIKGCASPMKKKPRLENESSSSSGEGEEASSGKASSSKEEMKQIFKKLKLPKEKKATTPVSKAVAKKKSLDNSDPKQKSILQFFAAKSSTDPTSK